MEYIAHRPFARKVLGGEVNIRRGDKLREIDGALFFGETPVCLTNCQAAKEHFAINRDGCGLRRGDLTYEIAFGKPLTEMQKDALLADPAAKEYLVDNCEVILFSNAFFRASMLELWRIAAKLGIKE